MEFAFEDDSDSLASLEARILKAVEIISTLREENASLRKQLQTAIEEKERVSKDTKDASSRADKVMAELESGAGRDETARLVGAASWCLVRPLFAMLPPVLSGALGAGETAVIHTALTEKISTVVIDERKGRRMAAMHGLRVTGSLGLLLALRRRGLLASMPLAIARMKAKGIHLSDDLVDEALKLDSR